MSDDIVKRLRDQGRATFAQYSPGMWQLCAEAAERIEALEAALREIEMKLMALDNHWALEGGPFDGGWISEVMALAPEQNK
jgi:hypothetical protein